MIDKNPCGNHPFIITIVFSVKLREQILLSMIYLDCPGSIEKEVCAHCGTYVISAKKQIKEQY